MVGYRERPRVRNARWAEVIPSEGSDQSKRLVVYRQHGHFYAKHQDDEFVFGLVVPVEGGARFVCASAEQARRLGYS